MRPLTFVQLVGLPLSALTLAPAHALAQTSVVETLSEIEYDSSPFFDDAPTTCCTGVGRSVAVIDSNFTSTRLAFGQAIDGSSAGDVWIVDIASATGAVLDARSLVLESSMGFSGGITGSGSFGRSLASADVNNDSLPDLIVGEADAGAGRLWILTLDAAGTVTGETLVEGSSLGFTGPSQFGSSLSVVSDGTNVELAVGAMQSSAGGVQRGAVAMVTLDPTGSVVAQDILVPGLAGMPPLADDARLGLAVLSIEDLDLNGQRDLIVSTPGGPAGADSETWLLLRDGASILASYEITNGFLNYFWSAENLRGATSLAEIKSLPGDFRTRILVGVRSSVAYSLQGFIAMEVDLQGLIKSWTRVRIDEIDVATPGYLPSEDVGSALAVIPDMNQNKKEEFVLADADGSTVGSNYNGFVFVIEPKDGTVNIENGTGINPLALTEGATAANIGFTWKPFLDVTAFGAATPPAFSMFQLAASLAATPTPMGATELLIDPSTILFPGFALAGQPYLISIPDALHLVGMTFAIQSVVSIGGVDHYSNALEFTLGW